MRKLNVLLVIIMMGVFASCGSGESKIKENVEPDYEFVEDVLIIEDIPEETCTSDIGVILVDENANPTQDINQYSALLKLLQSNDSSVVYKVVYELKGSYGNNVKMNLIYDSKDEVLREIYMSSHMADEYKNITKDKLITHLVKAENSFIGLVR